MPRLFRTMRFKLAGTFLLLAGAFQLALLIALPLARDRYVLRSVDEAMARHAQSLQARLTDTEDTAGELTRWVTEADAYASPYEFLLLARDPQGRVIAATSDLGGVEPAFDPAHAAPPSSLGVGGRGVGTERVSPEAPPGMPEVPFRMRVGTIAVGPEGPPAYYLQIAHSLAWSDHVGGMLRAMLAAALAIGLTVAAIAGWLVAGMLVRRIDQMREAVRSVNPQRLHEALPLPHRDDELGAMAADIGAMLLRLANAFKSQEQFLSNVSHELKTPVAALLTEAQVLKYAPADEETYKTFVTSVEDEMRRLGSLVESFLMLARFGQGKRFVAENLISLNDAALDSIEHSALLADQTHVTLRLTLHDAGDHGSEPLVRGDAELLRVVIDNLVRNAVQFSKPGDTVHTRVGVNAEHVVVEVADQGPGVQPEFIDRIFDRWQQAPNQNTGRRGTGLGLTIAKGVVELHRGMIDLQNRPEGGCMFTVRLPLAHPGGRKGIPVPVPGVAAHNGEHAPSPARTG